MASLTKYETNEVTIIKERIAKIQMINVAQIVGLAASAMAAFLPLLGLLTWFLPKIERPRMR